MLLVLYVSQFSHSQKGKGRSETKAKIGENYFFKDEVINAFVGVVIKPALRAPCSTVSYSQWTYCLLAVFLYPPVCFLKATPSVNALARQQHNHPVSSNGWNCGQDGGKPSNIFILLTEVISAMTYERSWAFVSDVMNHPFPYFQGCAEGTWVRFIVDGVTSLQM